MFLQVPKDILYKKNILLKLVRLVPEVVRFLPEREFGTMKVDIGKEDLFGPSPLHEAILLIWIRFTISTACHVDKNSCWIPSLISRHLSKGESSKPSIRRKLWKGCSKVARPCGLVSVDIGGFNLRAPCMAPSDRALGRGAALCSERPVGLSVCAPAPMARADAKAMANPQHDPLGGLSPWLSTSHS